MKFLVVYINSPLNWEESFRNESCSNAIFTYKITLPGIVTKIYIHCLIPKIYYKTNSIDHLPRHGRSKFGRMYPSTISCPVEWNWCPTGLVLVVRWSYNCTISVGSWWAIALNPLASTCACRTMFRLENCWTPVGIEIA